MGKLGIIGAAILMSFFQSGCATYVIDGVSAQARSEGAVIIGEGHGAGRLFLDVIPGASQVAGDKAPGVVNKLTIEKINGHPISASKGDEYWINEGSYTFVISCGFKNIQGYSHSAEGTTEATIFEGNVYKIEGEIKVTGKDFLGRNTYQCSPRIVEQKNNKI